MSNKLTSHLQYQKALFSRVWADDKNKEYMVIALAAGLISSLASERLYRRITGLPEIKRSEDEKIDPVLLSLLLGAVTGSAALLYKINRAHKVTPLL